MLRLLRLRFRKGGRGGSPKLFLLRRFQSDFEVLVGQDKIELLVSALLIAHTGEKTAEFVVWGRRSKQNI
jgi:hypothetical protein